MLKFYFTFLSLAGSFCLVSPVLADSPSPPSPVPAVKAGTSSREFTDRRIAGFLSGEGTVLYLGLGTALPLTEDGGRSGRSRAARTAVAIGASQVLTRGLKSLAREERPDGTDRKSFPSGHASAAFALATARAQFRPEQAPYWYAGAALISASRVRLRRHYAHDVIAGAALGHFTARYVLKQWHDPRSNPSISFSGGEGVSVRFSF